MCATQANVFQLKIVGHMHKYNILNGQQSGPSSRTDMNSHHFSNLLSD